MIRGRIVALNGTPVRNAKIENDAKWAVNGDRGITYAATPPPETDIAQGKWWPANYSGPTLISFDADLALGAGTFAASIVTEQIFDVPFVFDPQAALLTIIGGGAITLAMGLIGSWVALAAKPSTQLRNP
jgi:putative ABC transport system permease protein